MFASTGRHSRCLVHHRQQLWLVLILLHLLIIENNVIADTTLNDLSDDARNDIIDSDTSRSTSTKKKQHPNILLLLTDDQDVLLGSFDYMPNVRNLLQHQGMTFENFFVHTPVCCPSRSSILTGRYLHNCGARNNSIEGNCYGPEWRAEMENTGQTYNIHAQNEGGYTTVYAGKYLNRYGQFPKDFPSRIPPGWDHWLGLVGNSVYYNYTLIDGGTNKPTHIHKHGDDYAKDYLPDVMMNYTMNLLPTLPEPWLVVLGWPSCHGPFTPASWANGTMVDKFPPTSTENYNATSKYQQQKHWLIRQLHPLSNKTANAVNRYYQMRLETLKSIDEHTKTLVETLEEQKQLHNTVIMYTSDNGFQFGQHRLAIDKRHLYEHDIRVPFVIRGPNIPHNTTSHQLIASIDIAPTIVDIATPTDSIEKKATSSTTSMDGLSFWKYVTQGQERDTCFANRHDILISYNGEGNPKCGMADCPPTFNGIWWMPDSYNNTYHCVRTVRFLNKKGDDDVATENNLSKENGETEKEDDGEDTIYCRFEDDENFVEYYDLKTNPQQLTNDYYALDQLQRQRYEHRLQELLKCQGSTCRPSHSSCSSGL